MAVLTNTMMQGTAAISDEEAYEIKKGLRFASQDSSRLSNTRISSGNRRTFTLSWWQKKSIQTTADNKNCGLISARTDDNTHFVIGQENSGQMHFDDRVSGNLQLNTGTGTYKFTDTGAWMHIVFVCDTNNVEQDERQIVYVNGERRFTHAHKFDWAEEAHWNYGEKDHWIGHMPQSNWGYPDVQLANIEHIDGLALNPGAFGSFDSANNWNPKAFAIPQHNDGTTWSSQLSGSFNSSAYNGTKAFDGNTNSSWSLPADNTSITWTPTDPIVANCSIRLKISKNGNGGALKQNGADIEHLVASGWVELPERTITSLVYGAGSSGNQCQLMAVEVDGVVLVDGLKVPEVRSNKNKGEVLSTHGTFTNVNTPANIFDGKVRAWSTTHNETTMASGSSNSTWSWDLGSSHKITGVETIGLHIWPSSNQSGSNLVKINDTDVTAAILAHGERWIFIEFDDFTEFEKIEIANNYWYLAGITINGHLLKDNLIDNSFHFKFEDDIIGLDSLSNAGEDGVGALPIYKTNISGTKKETGYREDPNKSYLVFAMPGDALTDDHDDIKGSGTAHTVTNDGVAVSTAASKLYGSSLYFDDDRLSCSSHADFNLHGGDWCVEGWFYSINDTEEQQILIENGTAGTAGWSISRGTNRKLYLYVGSTEAMGSAHNVLTPDNEWYHVALQRTGSETTYFVNGRPKLSVANDASDAVDGLWIGERSNGTLAFKGYMNDIRIYKGVAPYPREGFKPFRYGDWSSTNLKGTVVNNSISSQSHTGHTRAFNLSTLFDGDDDKALGADYSIVATSSDSTSETTITFGTAVSGNLQVRHHNGNNQVQGAISVDNGSNWTNCHTNGTAWVDMGTVSNLTILKIRATFNSGGGSTTYWKGVKVDGVLIATNGGELEDVTTDTPTNSGSDTGLGGEVTGNFARYNDNHRNSNAVIRQAGYLLVANGGGVGWALTHPTMYATSGKWYCEWTLKGGTHAAVGMVQPSHSIANDTTLIGSGNSGTGGWGYLTTGSINHGSGYDGYGAWDAGDTVGCAVDIDSGKIWWHLNGTWRNDQSGNTGNPATGANPMFTDCTGPVGPGAAAQEGGNNTDLHFNPGNRKFLYAAPSGFKCWCTQNLPNLFSGEELNNPSKYFNVVERKGFGSNGGTVTIGFPPGLIWEKTYGTSDHALYDRIRGAGYWLETNNTDAQPSQDLDQVDGFTSTGYTLGDNEWSTDTNLVSWNWNAGTAANTSTNTDGDNITVAVGNQWVNATAGFSITKYAGDGSGAANSDSGDAVGHGLSAKPDFVIIKKIDGVNGWPCWHNALGDAQHISLNSGNGKESSNHCYTTEPTNTKVDLGNNGEVNGTGNNYIMYAWTAIPGYSAFGTYEGNGSTNGPFVDLGFEPHWVMIKSIDASSRNWFVFDTTMGPYNDGSPEYIIPSANYGQGNNPGGNWDMYSNGFKIRTSNAEHNNSGETFLYACFARNPFKTSRAR